MMSPMISFLVYNTFIVPTNRTTCGANIDWKSMSSLLHPTR